VTWRYRGAAVTGYWNDSYAQQSAFSLVDHLKQAGVNTIQLLVSWFQPDMRSSALAPDYNGQSPTDESVRALIDYIHKQGMQVMLKPHAEPILAWDGRSEGWRGVIDPADREAWFASYVEFIMHYAHIAADSGAELFCVGSEMASMTRSASDQAQWTALADRVRTVYPGQILYHATWYEVEGGDYADDGPDGKVAFSAHFEPLPASFWSHFDYAGLGAYFDLYSPHVLNSPDPGVDLLAKSWYTGQYSDRPAQDANLVEAISGWQQRVGKPVIFAEAGYQNLDYAGYDSYEYNPLVDEGQSVAQQPNQAAQADAYQATFEVWGGVPWLAGAFWWQFNPDEPVDAACGDLQAELKQTGYSPCGRPAMQILTQWYRQEQ
jgi:hypothetical protein